MRLIHWLICIGFKCWLSFFLFPHHIVSKESKNWCTSCIVCKISTWSLVVKLTFFHQRNSSTPHSWKASYLRYGNPTVKTHFLLSLPFHMHVLFQNILCWYFMLCRVLASMSMLLRFNWQDQLGVWWCRGWAVKLCPPNSFNWLSSQRNHHSDCPPVRS